METMETLVAMETMRAVMETHGFHVRGGRSLREENCTLKIANSLFPSLPSVPR
jgi:hypothetical protein